MPRRPHPWQARACRRVADALVATLFRRAVASADVLTPRQREVLELRAAGLPLRAVAERMGCTTENVRSLQARGMRRLAAIAAPLAVALVVASCDPSSAFAACGGHQTQITATPEGTIGLCPQDHDAAGGPVGAGYYRQCDVRAAWAGGGSATVTVMAPVPGVVVAVGFAAASGAGGATATCTNADGAVSPISASAITFRARLPAPVPPALEATP